MSWLSKKWEELSAQVNMRDGGKTASTVRANRQPVQPAQTKTPPKQNLWDRAVDVVSANTPADNYRRQQLQVDTTGTDEAMRMLQKQALSGQIDKNVAAAKIRALGTSDVQTNTAENVLKPTTPTQIAGQTVVDVAMNRKVAPVALGTGRSAAGTVEGVGGLYDLATPGDGVNRVSKVGVKAGQATDQAVKDNNYNQLAYKGSQAATDVAQYAIGAGGVKAVGKATTTLPYVPKVVSFADRVAQPLTKPISGAVEKGATNLAQKGFTGRVASKTLQNVTNPGYQAVNAGFTALQAGKEASHGTEVSPIGVTTNLVAGGVGFPLAGAVGGEVTRPIVNKAVSGLRKTNLVRPSNLNPGEVADLARMNEIAKTGAILDDNIYQRGVYAAQKAGIDHRDANQVDTLLGAHRNHDTLVQQRKQAIQDAKARVTRNPQTLLEPEGGYARIPVGKNDPAPDLSIEQKTLINDYAEMLQGMDDGNGVTILPDGSRASSNSQFYRKVFAEKGRAPSKADWFDEARRQIESGKAGFGASDDYKLLPSKDIGAVGKNVRKPRGEIGSSLMANGADKKLTVVKTPTGKYTLAGTIPEELTVAKKNSLGQGYRDSPVFDTEAQAKQFMQGNVYPNTSPKLPKGNIEATLPSTKDVERTINPAALKERGGSVVSVEPSARGGEYWNIKFADGSEVMNTKIPRTQPQAVGKDVNPLESLKQEARKLDKQVRSYDTKKNFRGFRESDDARKLVELESKLQESNKTISRLESPVDKVTVSQIENMGRKAILEGNVTKADLVKQFNKMGKEKFPSNQKRYIDDTYGSVEAYYDDVIAKGEAGVIENYSQLAGVPTSPQFEDFYSRTVLNRNKTGLNRNEPKVNKVERKLTETEPKRTENATQSQPPKSPQVGTKVSYTTSVGEKTGTITKVPDTTKDLRIKGNSYKIKFDEPVQVGMQKPVKETYIAWQPGQDGLKVLDANTQNTYKNSLVDSNRQVKPAKSKSPLEKNPLEKDLQTAGVAPKKATDAEPPDFLKTTNAKGVIIKESKPQPDGTKIVVRATKNPETGKLQQFEERVDKNTDLPKAYEEPQVTERLAEYGKQAPEPRTPVTEVKGQAKKDLHESTNKFLGGYAGDKARNMGVARSLPKMNDEGSISIIDQIESGGDNSGLPTQIRAILDAKHKELKDAGVDIGYLQNYFPHRWVNEDKVKRAYQAVKLRASIQNERELPTVKEGIALGYKPKTKDYREAISDYLNTADKLLRNRTYFNELQKKNLILESYQPLPGMQVIDAPGLPKPRPHIDEVNGIEQQGNYYASPEVAKSLNRLFGDRKPHGAYEKTLDATAYVSRFLQDVGLAGGIPGTPLNAFTFAQVTKELLSGSIKNPIVATMKSFTKEGYRKYADQNNEAVQALQRQGIKIRDDYNFKNLGDEFTSMVEQEGGKKNMFAKGWDKVFSDPTFKRFMPSLQIEMFKKVQKGALKKGKTPEEAEKLAGDAVANFYGLNRLAKESFRSKPGTDAATTILFAPKYRESMINFLIVNNAKALNPAKWGAREYRQNQKFMVGAALMFAGENYANEYLNGVPMYQNPDGKKDKLIIPADRIPGKPTNGKDIAIPFLPSIATVPRYAGSAAYNLARGNTEQATKDASGFLSFGLRPLVDTFVTNENYFGDKIVEDGATPLDAAKQRGGYLLSQYQHPYIREAIRTKQGKNKSAFEAISKASEAPLRFYNPDTYRYDDKFVPKGPKGEKFTFSEQRDRAKTKKEIDGIADELGLSKRQKADFASLSAVEFNEDGTMKEDNNPFYRSQRFTKLQDDGVFEAMKKKAQLNAKLNGKPVDPIFNLDGEARRLVLWKKTLPPGTSDPSVKKLYEQDWYQEFRKAEDKYYTSKKDWNTKMGYANQPEDKSYPVASKQIEEAQNAYFKLPKGTGQRSAFIRNNPDVWNKMTAFWEAKDQWTNGERSKLGLGPVDEPATTGGYAYGKSGGKGKGKKKSNFDYSKNLFGSNGTSSTSVSSNLRKILAKAMKS